MRRISRDEWVNQFMQFLSDHGDGNDAEVDTGMLERQYEAFKEATKGCRNIERAIRRAEKNGTF